MNEYSFTLKFDVSKVDDLEALSANLYKGGCDDAVIGIGTTGRIALDFTREANSAADAVFSAISDVMKATPSAELVEITPDLVGFTEIADILGCTRQNVRKVIFGSSSYPLPFHEGRPTLWHLADMLMWFTETSLYDVEDVMVDLAKLNKSINACRSYNEIDLDVMRQVERVVAH